jgi:uncharacterized protein YneF (UPF0154 family)
MELDWLTIVVGAVCSLLGALGGGSIFFVKENKRSKQLENSQKIIEEWKEMYHEKEKKCNEKDSLLALKDQEKEQLQKKIGALYEQRSKYMAKRELELKQKDAEHADEIRQKNEEIAELKMRNAELEWNECRVNGCDRREPPRDRKCIGSCNSCKE